MSQAQDMKRSGTVLSLRLSKEQLALLDKTRVAIVPAGVELTRHAAARAALLRGLAVLTTESAQQSAP